MVSRLFINRVLRSRATRLNNNQYKIFAVVIAFILLACSQIALSAPPIAFDSWTENAGAINAPCPLSFQCIDGVKSDGILQRTIRAPSGEEYIQLIVVGVDLKGTVTTDESFVQMNTIGLTGISAKQTLNQSGTDPLISQTILNTGWANDLTLPAVDITQSLISSFRGVDYSDTFSFKENRDANGNSIGSYTDINQTLLNSSLLSSTPTTGRDVQTFAFRRASGIYNPNAGQVTLGRAMGGGMGGMGTGMMGNGNGGTLTWNAGDDVQVVWIGVVCDGCGSGGMGGGGGGMGGGGAFNISFAYQSFDNLVDARDPIASGSIVSSDPFVWLDPPFGVQPVLQ